MGYLRRILRDHRPSPAMVVASVALLVALGGTSVAAVNQLAANSVGTSQLKSNAVTTPKIKNSAVNASKLASNAVVDGEDCEQRRHECEDRKRHDPAGRPLVGCQDIRPGRRAGSAGPVRPGRRRGSSGLGSRLIRTARWCATGTPRPRRGTAPVTYQVIFNQDVTGCSYQATPGGPTTRPLHRGNYGRPADGGPRRSYAC